MINYFALFVVIITFFTGCSSSCKKKIVSPNILFAIADDVTYPHMGSSNWIRTPAFDRVSQQGIVFTQAYTPNAKCAPSRACILTGRNSWQLEEAANHMCYFPAKFKTFPEVLAGNGYQVGYTGKGWVPGIALTEDGKSRDLLVKAYNKHKLVPAASEISSDDYAGNFEDFLNDNPGDKPFFFWYGGWEPHRPYEFGSGISNGKKLSEIEKVYPFWPDVDSVKTDLLDYAYELEYFDLQLQKMITLLEKRGMLENTVIIVTADNGMPFPRIKGQEYEFSNHLPLAIMWPEGIKKSGRIIDDFVSFIDFAPTILTLAGIDPDESGMYPVSGTSLTDILNSSKSGMVSKHRDHVLIGKERHDIGRPENTGYPIRGIVKGDYLYLRNFEPERWPVGNPETGYLNCDGSPTKTICLDTYYTEKETFWQLNFGKRSPEELYNIRIDPYCMTNLAKETNFSELKDKLETQMVNELKSQEDPRVLGNGAIFDRYPVAPSKYMDYYEKYIRGEVGKVDWVNPSDYRKQ